MKRKNKGRKEPGLPPAPSGTPLKILKSAEKLFLRRGYAATSMREIAKASGLGLSSLYNHYKSKEEIFEALIELHSPVPSVERLLSILGNKPFPDSFYDLARGLGEIIDSSMSFIRLTDIDAIEFSGRKTIKILQEIISRAATPILSLYDHLQREGKLRPVDPMTSLPFLILLLASIFVLRNRFGNFGILTLPDPEKSLKNITDIVLYGIAERRPETFDDRDQSTVLKKEADGIQGKI